MPARATQVNGRLAMLGFVFVAMQENQTGETVLFQLNHVSVGTCLLLAVWVYASLAPILKGVKQEAFGEQQWRSGWLNGLGCSCGCLRPLFAVCWLLASRAARASPCL